MSEPLFFAPQLKLERAEKFISELKEEIEAYRQSKPFSASYNMSADPPHVSVTYAAIPRIHSAILGDAVHNLRTALDLMACELVRLQDCSDKDVYFPFSNSAEELEDAIKRVFTGQARMP